MQHNRKFAVTVRGIVIDNDELLMVKHKPDSNFYALPGGKLEIGEHLSDALARELVEEVGITPIVGQLLFINDWIGPNDHRVEFFFRVDNGKDYRRANPTKASHGFEIAEVKFTTPKNVRLLPSFVADKFEEILQLGGDFQTQLLRSE